MEAIIASESVLVFNDTVFNCEEILFLNFMSDLSLLCFWNFVGSLSLN